MKDKYKLVIIGGGASGMMAAVSAVQFSGLKGEEILIIEKNTELGKKLKITGGGRCNILNAEYDVNKLLDNYGENKKYLFSIFSEFGVEKTVQFFKNLGIEIKIEDRKRAFPKTEKALDVFNSLYKIIEKNNVNILTETSVKKFIKNSSNKITEITVITKNKFTNKLEEKTITAEKFILSTGGYSHPETGSTGDGFGLLQEIDSTIKINKPNPSLVPIISNDKWVHKLSGKTVEDLKLTIKIDCISKKVIKYNPKSELKNRILFTHFGLSGPTILNNSKTINDFLSEGEVSLVLDLFPKLDEGSLDDFLLSIFDNNKNKKIRNILNEIYPGNILEIIFERFLKSFDLEKQVNEIKKEERKNIIKILKNLEIKITGLMGYEKAIVADGGVDPSEVDFKNMSLKKILNLHIVGDMLDIQRPSGGFSLQLCWTSGYVAGRG